MKQLFMRKNALGSATVSTEEVPAPRCGAASVLVRNCHSLISAGTESAAVGSSKRDMIMKALRSPDLRQAVLDMLAQDGIERTASRVHYEMTKWTALGYSGAGIAIEVGREVDGIKLGDVVAHGGQGHAEIIRAPKNLCVRVPENVPTDEAAFVALGSIALQAVRRARIEVGDVCAVLGLGLVGQLVSQILMAAGARVLGSDFLDSRTLLARSLGVEATFTPDDQLADEIVRHTSGLGVDRVLVCASSSNNSIIEQAVAMCRERGTVVVVGAVRMDIPRDEFYMKELDLVISRSYGPGRYDPVYEDEGRDYPIGFVRWTERRNMQEFLRLVAAGRVRVRPLISHEFEMTDAAAAYDLLMNQPDQCLATVLKYADAPDRDDLKRVASNDAQPRQKPGGSISVVGCGSFARQFHLPNVARSRQLSLHSIVASSAQSAKDMAVRFGAGHGITDPSLVFADPAVDAVMILTRDASHADLACRAAGAGKHVFCEKPLATTLDECRRIASAFHRSGLVCMTGFNRRFAPLLVRMKQSLAERHGPKMIQCRVNAGSLAPTSWVYQAPHSAGRIVGEACHFVDLCYWLVESEPVRVTAHAIDAANPDIRIENVSATIEYADGSVANLIYTAAGCTAAGKERLEVFADGGSWLMDDYRRLTIRGPRRADVTSRRIDKGHDAEIRHFENCLLRGEPASIGWEDGVRATIATVAILESIRGACTIELDNPADYVTQ